MNLCCSRDPAEPKSGEQIESLRLTRMIICPKSQNTHQLAHANYKFQSLRLGFFLHNNDRIQIRDLITALGLEALSRFFIFTPERNCNWYRRRIALCLCKFYTRQLSFRVHALDESIHGLIEGFAVCNVTGKWFYLSGGPQQSPVDCKHERSRRAGGVRAESCASA